MDWQDYRNIFLNFQQSETETRLISLMTQENFKDFPSKMPVKLRQSISIVMKAIDKSKEIIEKLNPKTGKIEDIVKIDFRKIKPEDLEQLDNLSKKYANLFLQAKISSMGREEKFEDVLNIPRLLASQSFIMHFSNFEGILADSFRAVCYTRPEVLKKDKLVKVDEILSAKSWQGLITMLTEKSVLELGYQNLEERVETFEKLFGLKIGLKSDDKKFLKTIDLIKNIIVHNGGKANEAYIRLMKDEQIKIGQYVLCDDNLLEFLSWKINYIACEIFLQISDKHFGVSREDAQVFLKLPT